MSQTETTTTLHVAQAIRERRTIKQFKPEPVSLELLKELLDVAVWAPNHGLREPWRFIAFHGDGSKFLADAIGSSMGGRGPVDPEMLQKRKQHLLSIPMHLIVIMPNDPRQRERDEDFAAASTMIQNLQLAAWERGVGVLWKSDPYIYAPKFREQLGVQPGESIVALLHMGYPESIPAPRPRTAAEQLLQVVHREHGFSS